MSYMLSPLMELRLIRNGLSYCKIVQTLRLWRQFSYPFHLTRQHQNYEGNISSNQQKADEDKILISDDISDELLKDKYLHPSQGHRVFVVQPDNRTISKKQRITTPDLQLAELCSLVESLPDWRVIEQAIYSLKYIDKKTLFGSGNFDEIGRRVRRCKGVTAVVMGVDMLTVPQLSTLQDSWGVAVYDRYTIVLQIFQTRAKTKAAKLQVALAEIPYYRSRLQGMHSGLLDQQKGGMQFIGGSGETFLEARQRVLADREVKLRKSLELLKNQRDMLRLQRTKREFPVVAVIGYTNAGKTSLIKALTGDQTMEPRDQLFATLDVTMHAGLLPNRLKVLFVDTVGFISDIPTSLIASFSATLEDVIHADVLVHVRDISHPDTAAQKINVLQTLQGLHLPISLIDGMIEVCNKSDLITESCQFGEKKSLKISVKEGWGLSELSEKIQENVMAATGRIVKRLRIPMNGPHLAWLYKEATVESTHTDETDTEKLLVDVLMTHAVYAKFLDKFVQIQSKNNHS